MAALIKKDDLTPYTNAPIGDPTWDARLEDLVLAASAMIEYFLGYELEKKARTEYHPSMDVYNPTPGELQYIWLKARPVDVGSSVEVAYSDVQAWSDNILTATEYFVDAEKGCILVVPSNTSPASTLSGASYRESPIGFRVVYTAGYTKTADATTWDWLAVPEAIKSACGLQTAHMFNALVRGSANLESVETESQAAEVVKLKPVKGTLIPGAVSLLKPYLRMGTVPGVIKY